MTNPNGSIISASIGDMKFSKYEIKRFPYYDSMEFVVETSDKNRDENDISRRYLGPDGVHREYGWERYATVQDALAAIAIVDSRWT